MKKNLPVTNTENDFPKALSLVSTTDLKGVINHCNDDFETVSGFTRDALLGSSHNIVRHPDMPPAVFDELWTTIKSGKPWMGVVKNRCHNGDHYWVDAFITPTIADGKTTGYQSVRLKPSKSLVARAESVYKPLWKPVSGWKKVLKALRPSLRGRVTLTAAASLIAAVVTQSLLTSAGQSGFVPLLAAVSVGLVFAFTLAAMVARPWRAAAEEARSIYDDATAASVYTGRSDELASLKLALHFQAAKLQTVVWRVADTSSDLAPISAKAAATSRQTASEMSSQMNEIDLVATAMTEMSATVQEIASNANATASATRDAQAQVDRGEEVVNDTVNTINRLSAEVAGIQAVIDELASNSGEVSSVVDVIRDIAEQTNLLALNAAIEAARAGDQGRGFAVVADEVRGLAARTQQSTEEIQTIIAAIQSSTSNARSAMSAGRKVADESVSKARLAGESLAAIREAVASAADMTDQIATAAEEQSAVSAEIDKNITHISSAAQGILSAADDNTETSQSLSDAVVRLNTMCRQFSS